MSEYGFPDEPGDDYAAMLAEVEQQADARTVRLALGVSDDELDRIRTGHAPGEKTAERLRMLHEVSRKADLSDPRAVLAALTRGGARPRSPVAALSALGLGRHAKLVVVAFVVFEVLVALAIVAVVFLRGL